MDLPAATNPLALLPAGDVPLFLRESDGAKRQVLAWLPRCQALAEAPHGARGQLVTQLARAAGCSPSTVRARYTAWRRRGWLALIDRRKHPEPDHRGSLPHATRQWIKSLFERFQRNNGARQVHRYLLDRWRRWQETLDPEFRIPGYSSPPLPGPDGLPPGFSYRTVCRLRPRAVNLALTRQGRKAAKPHLPNNYTTRVGLSFLQRIFFDDQQYDTKTFCGTNSKPTRPHGFNSLDHLSGCFLDQTYKATYWDADEAKKRELTQRDFTFFHLRGLLQHGYRDDDAGTTCIFEHGTTTGYNNKALTTLSWHGHGSQHSYDDALHLVTRGRVSIDRSGRFNDPLFAGMLFRPQSTGNFQYKSPIESLFNLVRNHHAALPAPTGMDRHHAPAEQYGEDAYTASLVKIASQLPAERADRLRLSHMNFYEWCAIADHIYRLINQRTDHQLEGWDRCGFVQPHFRVEASLPWITEDELIRRVPDPERRAAVIALADKKPLALSPAQVRDAYRCDPAITKLDPDLVPFLLPTQWAYDIVVKPNHEIHLSDPDLYPGCRAIFIAEFSDRDQKTALRAGTKLRAWWHPIIARCWITRPDGQYLGCLHEFIRPTAGDRPAILQNQGKINSLSGTLSAASVRRAHDLAAERQALKRHNDRLQDPDHPVTDDEKAAQRAADRLARPDPDTHAGLTLEDL